MRTALEATLPANDLSIADLWPIYLRRKRLFYVILAAVVLPVILYCCVATRRYQATGSVEVQNPMVGGMELSDVFNSQELSTDAMTTGLDLQTQADILQSQTLALQVIRELNLEQSADFQRQGVLTKVLSVFTFWKKPATPTEAGRRARDLQIFSKNLKVKVESGTRLIRVSYRSADALVAAEVVNHLITDLVEFDLQTRSAAGTHASKWLTGQLGDLRKQSEDLQAKVVKLQQQMGIFSLGDNDSTGKPQVYSTVLDQVQQDTAALSAAQSNRILKGALYQVVKDGNPELISGLTGNAMSGASPAVNNSLGVIQNLREQEATLKEDIAHDSAKFGANYPPLNEKRAALKGLDQSIAAEDSRIAARAKSDYDIAVNAEANTRKLFEQARQKADQLNNKAIEFTIAQKQADESRGLFEDLSKRLQEAGLVQGLRPSNIATVDPGQTPAKPSFPNVPLFMAAAVGAGLFFGSAGALFADIVDRRVQTVDELEHGDLPLLGIVPHLETKRGGYSLEDVSASRSAFHEAMRGLRISLMWNNVLKEPRVVLVTSALAGEGKSTIAKGLAMAMAQRGRKVLLIEADLYRPCMKKDLDLDDRGGLSMVLREDGGTPDDGMVTPFPAKLPNLQILQAGEAEAASADLLESSRMNNLIKSCRGRFDSIILDGPPILSATDAVPLAMLADTTILVARVGQTPRIALSRACNKLQTHKRHCDVRVALNAIKADSYAFYNYYGTRQGRAQEEEQHASA